MTSQGPLSTQFVDNSSEFIYHYVAYGSDKWRTSQLCLWKLKQAQTQYQFAPEEEKVLRTCPRRIVVPPLIPWDFPSCYDSAMRNLVVLFIHFIAILARLLGPGGVRSLVAESLLVKHQLLIVNRSRQRSPNLRASDRVLAGWMALWLRPTRLLRSAIVLKPSTLLGLQKAMSKQKYRMLFSSDRRRKPGPKGPSTELIHAVVEMKQRNPNWGYPRIAQQIALAFHIPIDKDVVRRILAHHYRPGRPSGGPSWLTFLGHLKDSLWSIDLFRCESATLRTYWVLVVMDQYTRRIIGFGVQAGTVDGVALCRMFNRALRGHRWLPKYLSSDNDPLYRFHQWQANLRISGGDRNQDRPLRSPVPPLRGKANRHHSTRVFGSHVVLDDGRSGKQTARFQDLLQPPSHAYLTGRANAGYSRVTTST